PPFLALIALSALRYLTLNAPAVDFFPADETLVIMRFGYVELLFHCALSSSILSASFKYPAYIRGGGEDHKAASQYADNDLWCSHKPPKESSAWVVVALSARAGVKPVPMV